MSIKQQTSRGANILVGLVLFAIFVAGISVREISVGGPIHSENKLQADLIADILPPPEYIIEPYLEATMAAKDGLASEHVDRLARLRKDYETRKAFWQGASLNADLKKQMVVANQSADAFWIALESEFTPALQSGNLVSAQAVHEQKLTPLYQAHRNDINKLVDLTLAAQASLDTYSKWIIRGSVGALLLVAGALIMFLRVGAGKLRRYVVAPIDDTAKEMHRMAGGDFDVTVSGLGRDDEIGQMARAMEVFRETGIAKAQADAKQKRVVNDLGHGLAELARGNLTHRITEAFPSEYEDLRASFNRTMDDLAEILTRVTTSASNVDTGANEIRTAADDLSLRTEQQASALAETAGAINQATEMALATAKARTGVRSSIDDAQREAQEGGAVVEQAVKAMGAIEHSAQEITQIINVIDGIAFQTNLLALNAGVEAARAGDAGKGFAVVANEVRALAQRSAEAAKDIKDLITTSAQQVEQGVGLVGETGSVLSRIVARVNEVSELITSIANSSDSQAQNMEQVNGSVSDMDRMTQQNAAMVEETTAAARSLASEAQELKQLVSRFQISGGFAGRSSASAPVRGPSSLRQSSGNLALASEPDGWDDF